MAQYSIKDVELLSGVKAHTIRIWEQRYNIVEPERTDTNIRYYTDTQVKRIMNVATLVQAGVKISKAAELDTKELNDAVFKLDDSTYLHEKSINKLVEALMNVDAETFKETLLVFDKFSDKVDFFNHIIFPFLHKVGSLWASDSINPAQEHFASNLIKRFIINKIESIDVPYNNKGSFLAMLPEGEWHEISLLAAEFVLRTQGYKVFYLGASVPEADVMRIISYADIQYILSVAIKSISKEYIQNHINNICKVAPDKTFYFAGLAYYHPNLKIPHNAFILNTFQELRNLPH